MCIKKHAEYEMNDSSFISSFQSDGACVENQGKSPPE